MEEKLILNRTDAKLLRTELQRYPCRSSDACSDSHICSIARKRSSVPPDDPDCTVASTNVAAAAAAVAAIAAIPIAAAAGSS